MYKQPVLGPAMPPILRHIYLAKPCDLRKANNPAPAPTGVLAELAVQRCH